MWVRVRVRRPGGGAELTISAYANGGFRAGRPEILLPPPLAERLGFDIRTAPLSEGIACGGVHIAARELGEVEVRVDVEDRETSWVRAQATCVEGEVEALMSRELIAALGIIPYYGHAAWRLEDDPPELLRPEAEPQYWP